MANGRYLNPTGHEPYHAQYFTAGESVSRSTATVEITLRREIPHDDTLMHRRLPRMR